MQRVQPPIGAMLGLLAIGRAEGQYGKEEKATAYVAPEEELRLNCVRSIRRLLLSIVPIGFFPWQSQQKKP